MSTQHSPNVSSIKRGTRNRFGILLCLIDFRIVRFFFLKNHFYNQKERKKEQKKEGRKVEN